METVVVVGIDEPHRAHRHQKLTIDENANFWARLLALTGNHKGYRSLFTCWNAEKVAVHIRDAAARRADHARVQQLGRVMLEPRQLVKQTEVHLLAHLVASNSWPPSCSFICERCRESEVGGGVLAK